MAATAIAPLACIAVFRQKTLRPINTAELTMAGSAENKLRELGISLPKPPAPIANYVPFVRTG